MKFTKLKPLSGRSLSILFLIVVPFISTFPLLISFYVYILYRDIVFFEVYYFIEDSQPLLLLSITFLLFIGYGLYPYTFSAKRYFKILGNLNVVKEYEILKTIIYIVLPIAIAVTIAIITISNFVTDETLFQLDREGLLQLSIDEDIALSLGPNSSYFDLSPTDQLRVLIGLYSPRIDAIINVTSFVPLIGPLVQETLQNYPYNKIIVDDLLGSIQVFLFLLLYAALFRLLMHEARKDFRYYFAKAYLEIGAESHDEVDRIKCLAKGLNYYDKYLKRSLNLQIKTLKEVQQKIAVADIENRNRLLQSTREEMNDRFDIIKRLSEFLYVRSIEDLLEPENIKLRIVEVSPFVAAVVIPIIVAIIQFFAD